MKVQSQKMERSSVCGRQDWSAGDRRLRRDHRKEVFTRMRDSGGAMPSVESLVKLEPDLAADFDHATRGIETLGQLGGSLRALDRANPSGWVQETGSNERHLVSNSPNTILVVFSLNYRAWAWST